MSSSDRVSAVRDILADTSVGALLITNPANRRYLTGFTAEDHAADESSGVLLVTPERAVLLVSPTNLPWARAEADADAVAVEPLDGTIADTVRDMLARERIHQIAVEDATTPAAVWFALQDALGEGVEIVRLGDSVDRLRDVKSDAEIEHLREAARLTDEAFALAASRFKTGMTERQAADHVRAALREVGSEGEAFDTIVATGPNAAKPHHRPGETAFTEGTAIIVDMGARVSGYNGDLTRTVCLGKADVKLVGLYEAVLEAQMAGLAAIRSGVPASVPDLATREVFASHGLEEFVIHSAGHGLGLRVHEAPSVRKTSTTPLAAGNVVTMEPGLYIEGWGGVRIEDVAVVRDDAHENITRSPKGTDVLEL